ncbi:hypothetical protein [Spongiivirga citrea]|uniref:Uncharacterized protein n=1 Tax=Spongiivirga citrea TaxID=1481457 RepID=A0A6M0CDT2_9FLAO|nr:hypothetical protein [Spongiivirga citrea]NER15976.1 hypothetical protein [Spongiivirga citrea]
MKKISVFLLATVFAVGSVLANETEPKTINNAAISAEMTKLLKTPEFDLNEDVRTLVKFTLNDENEIVVLSIDSKDQRVRSYIKSSLNYKKLDTKVNKEDLPEFKLPVTIKKSK